MWVDVLICLITSDVSTVPIDCTTKRQLCMLIMTHKAFNIQIKYY